MQAIMETLFDIVYLCTVITLGVIMIAKAQGRGEVRLFGIMAVVLGCGDAFHLVPRAYALYTDGLAADHVLNDRGRPVTVAGLWELYLRRTGGDDGR